MSLCGEQVGHNKTQNAFNSSLAARKSNLHQKLIVVSVQTLSCNHMVILSIFPHRQFLCDVNYTADRLMSDVNRADSLTYNYGEANCLILSQVYVASSGSAAQATVQLFTTNHRYYIMGSFSFRPEIHLHAVQQVTS